MPRLESYVAECGFRFERIEVNDPKKLKSLEYRLYSTGVDGILLGPVEPEIFLQHFQVDQFSLVADSRHLVNWGFESVRANHFLSVQRLLQNLVARNYRHIVVILREHSPLHGDDFARYGGAMSWRAMMEKRERITVLRWSFRDPDLSPEEQLNREFDELQKLHKKQPIDVLVGIINIDREFAQQLIGSDGKPIDYASLMVTSPEVGSIAGIRCDQDIVVVPFVRRLIEKVKSRSRGLSEHPGETVVSLPLVDGRSLRRPLEVEQCISRDPVREVVSTATRNDSALG